MVAYKIYSCKGQGFVQQENGQLYETDSLGQPLKENALYNIQFNQEGVIQTITKVKDVSGSPIMYVRFQVYANTIYTLDDAEYNKYGVYDAQNNNVEYRASYCDNYLLITFPDFSQTVEGPIYEIYSCNGYGYINENGGQVITTDDQNQLLVEHALYNLKFDTYGGITSVTKVKDVAGSINLMYMRFEVPSSNQVVYSLDVINNVSTTFVTLGNYHNNLNEYPAEYCSNSDNNNKFLKLAFIHAQEPEPIPEPDPTCPENQYRLSDGDCHPCTENYFYAIGSQPKTCHSCKENYYLALDGTTCVPTCPSNSSVTLVDGSYVCTCNSGYFADNNVCLIEEVPFYRTTWFIVVMVIIALIIIAIIIGVSVAAAKNKKSDATTS
jgi:hypothetical protein